MGGNGRSVTEQTRAARDADQWFNGHPADEPSMNTTISGLRFSWKSLAASVAIVASAAAILAAGSATAPNPGRCVAMGLDTSGRESRLPKQVIANATNLTIRGSIPCMDQVMAWTVIGPYRAFEDGTVEMLASPVPPCQGSDYYVWIAFPK